MRLDMADVKPSLISWAIVGLMAATFFIAIKYAFNKWQVPGLSDLVAAL